MSRKLRESPLGEVMEAAGAEAIEVAEVAGKKSWWTARSFGDVDGERRALWRGAGLLDASARGVLVISGGDRAAWLHGLCTQDIKGLSAWQGAYACHIDIKGRVMADFWAGALEDRLVLDTEPGLGRALRRMLRRYVVMEDVALREQEEAAALEVFGAEAAAVVERASGASLRGLRMYALAEGELGGEECLLALSERLGVPGVRVLCAREGAAAAWEALRRAGARPCGVEAAEQVRIAHGRPRFGAELGEEVLFNEVGLGEAVSFTKGCYLGQEVVERVDARGNLGKRLMGLRISGEEAPPAGAEIWGAGRSLGSVSGAARWPEAGCVLGMGLVHRALNEAGSAVELRHEGQRWEATLVERREMPA